MGCPSSLARQSKKNLEPEVEASVSISGESPGPGPSLKHHGAFTTHNCLKDTEATVAMGMLCEFPAPCESAGVYNLANMDAQPTHAHSGLAGALPASCHISSVKYRLLPSSNLQDTLIQGRIIISVLEF